MTPQQNSDKEAAIRLKYGWTELSKFWHFDELGNVYLVSGHWNPIYVECLLKVGNFFKTEEAAKQAVKDIQQLIKRK